jgi:hypothetical protein
MNKKYIFFSAFGLFVILGALGATYELRNRGFRLSKLISPQPPVAIALPAGIEALLDQPFRFVGAGETSFVFLGEDGQTILKLFKHHHLFYKNFLFHLTFPGFCDAWRMRKIVSREKKFRHKRHPFFFNSCSLAFNRLKEDTGLIFLCLHPNPLFDRQVKLIDIWGIPRHFNLSRTEFALQQKAHLLFPYLEELLEQERFDKAKLAIDSLLAQILRRCQQGIGDRDPNMEINFGFIEGRAVEFDLGSFYSDPSLNSPFKSTKELFFTTLALQKWLEKHAPELLNYLLESIASINEREGGPGVETDR